MKFGSRRAFRLLLLAPPSSIHKANFGSYQIDEDKYKSLLSEAQRLRGRVYLRDGAIDVQDISDDGRLVHAHDEHSWQLLAVNHAGEVAGCVRYIPHDDYVLFSELTVAKSALARSRSWGSKVRLAVDAARARARRRGMAFAEVGGWALSEELRYTTAALEICLHVCALANVFGGALAITTATFRHRSSAILRKLGGQALVNDGVELPSYYDPQYDCEMEILQFDSDYPNPRYLGRINKYGQNLKRIPAICATSFAEEYAMSS